MPLPPSEFHIFTRVTRERMHGCLFAFEHATTQKQKDNIVKQLASEMQRPLDMMGVGLPMAKRAFAQCPLKPPFEPSRGATSAIASMLAAQASRDVVELFDVAAQDLPKECFHPASFAADMKNYTDAIRIWRQKAKEDCVGTWRVLAEVRAHLLADANEIEKMALTVDDHVHVGIEENVEHADVYSWFPRRASFQAHQEMVSLERAITAKKEEAATGLRDLATSLTKKISDFESLRQRVEGGEHVADSEIHTCCAGISADAGAIDAIKMKTPVCEYGREPFKIADNATTTVSQNKASLVAHNILNASQRQGPVQARPQAVAPARRARPQPAGAPTLPAVLAEAPWPESVSCAFSASSDELLTSFVHPRSGLPEMRAMNANGVGTTRINSKIPASDLEVNGGSALIVGSITSQIEMLKAREGKFSTGSIFRGTHMLQSVSSIAVFKDVAVVGSEDGFLEILRAYRNGLTSLGSFQAHHARSGRSGRSARIERLAVGDGFCASVKAGGDDGASATISIWSTTNMPTKRFFGSKFNATDKIPTYVPAQFLVAHGRYIFWSTGGQYVMRHEVSPTAQVLPGIRSVSLNDGDAVTSLGISDGLVAAGTAGAIQVWDSNTLVPRPRLMLPGITAHMAVPAQDRVHVHSEGSSSIRTFALGGGQ